MRGTNSQSNRQPLLLTQILNLVSSHCYHSSDYFNSNGNRDEVEMLDPVEDDDQLQQQLWEDDRLALD
jgi:hypothetical protein